MAKPHEWIEVGNRRWCVRCDVFQQGKPFVRQIADCEDTTPYAAEHPRDSYTNSKPGEAWNAAYRNFRRRALQESGE